MKSQAGVEYIIVIGFIVAILVPLLVLFYYYVTVSSDDIVNSQTNLIAAKVVDAAESVRSLGGKSQSNFRVTLPNKISGASVGNGEVTFNVSTSKGTAQVYHSTKVNIKGSLPTTQGTYDIIVKAKNDSVEISYR